MFALLLVAAASAGKYAYLAPPATELPAAVTVDFGAKGKVSVPRPVALPPYFWEATVSSPKGDAAALRFCQHVSVMGPPLCRVMLARLGRVPIELRQGVVGPLLWTSDGQYLVGAGTNTVRVWNLVGGLRTVTPKGRLVVGQGRWAGLTGMKISGDTLCVLLREDWYKPDASGRITQTNLSAVRYALPSLKRLESEVVSAASGREPDCDKV